MRTRERLEKWLRMPLGRKADSLAFHLQRSVERSLARASHAFDALGPLLRGARFERAVGRERLLLSEGRERFLVFTHDQIISKTVYRTGQFDFEKFERVFELLGGAPLACLVDIGANLGTICIPAVNRGYVQRAIAIEPEPGNFRLLSLNVELNELGGRIALHPVALGARDGEVLDLELSGDNSGDHRVRVSTENGSYGEAERQVTRIRSERLDSLVNELPARSLIWMDTQGYEGHILEGAPRLLASRVPLVTEVWPYGLARTGGGAAFRAAVAGYEAFYDLSERTLSRHPIAGFEALYERLASIEGYTDVLFV